MDADQPAGIGQRDAAGVSGPHRLQVGELSRGGVQRRPLSGVQPAAHPQDRLRRIGCAVNTHPMAARTAGSGARLRWLRPVRHTMLQTISCRMARRLVQGTSTALATTGADGQVPRGRREVATLQAALTPRPRMPCLALFAVHLRI